MAAFAFLYDDGTLLFKNGNVGDSSKTLVVDFIGWDTETYANTSDVPWHEYRQDITNVVFDCPEVKPVSTARWFQNCVNLADIDLTGLDMSLVKTVNRMFYGCANLQSVTLSDIATSSCDDFAYMFSSCESLTSIDLAAIDTSRGTVFDSMFEGCSTLTQLDASLFDMFAATDLYYMFYNCSSLEYIDISTWNMLNVENMEGLFCGCNSLSSVCCEEIDLSSATNTVAMFQECSSLTELELNFVNTNALNDINSMFANCASLQYLHVSFDGTPQLTSCSYLFEGCSSLQNVIINGLSVSSVVDADSMFEGCEMLTEVDLSDLRFDAVEDTRCMFKNCKNLLALDLSTLSLFYIEKAYEMFSGCTNLQSINFHDERTNSLTDLHAMFSGCESLTTLNLSSFDLTAGDENMTGLFDGCVRLQMITVGEYFSLVGDVEFPTPTSQYIEHADGLWYDLTGKSYAPNEIPSGVANTYCASIALVNPVMAEDSIISNLTLLKIANAIREVSNNNVVYKPSEMPKAITDIRQSFDWVGKLTFGGQYVEKDYFTESGCSLAVDPIRGMCFLTIQGSSSTERENIYFQESEMDLPSGVEFLSTQKYGGPTGGSVSRYFTAAFSGITGKIDVYVSFDTAAKGTYDYVTPYIEIVYV